MKLKTYKVWYTNHSNAKVKALSVKGARRQAWDMLGSFKYGWERADFLKNTSVEVMK